jgi:GTP pyrophosphokinase
MNEQSAWTLEQCRERLSARIDWDDDLESALVQAFNTEPVSPCRPRALDAALRLVDFDIDRPTLLATLLSDPGRTGEEEEERLRARHGEEVLRLWQDIHRLNSLQACNEDSFRTPEQAEKLRRLLMAIIRDVRVMLIKLCYRAARMQRLKYCDYDQRRCLARETLDIYAPLANRLGIGRLKWEMEDLSFRALEPQNYKRIARLLEERRADREAFIAEFTRSLGRLIREQGIEAEVSGRAKHIVSIWRKMQRKNLEFHQLFDVRAVRVLVDTVADCYAVLGIVHTHWHSIPDEFDDYIANPKDNGYQSLHTAVIAEGGRVVEVQIRSHEMHEKSEFGVASHWRYKEGVALDQRMERSLQKMRELLESEEADANDLLSGFSTELSTDRVYVFTPRGQVVDLPAGATPLDFAYSIHSQVGHRCRGAKVNGRIVPLTYELKTGQEVEVLTAREGGPSRDWMNKSLGYLKSASNRAKVRNWFNHLDFQQNVQDGRALYERELARHNLHDIDLAALMAHFKREDEEQFFADLARGLITVPQIIGHLQSRQNEEDPLRKLRRTERSGQRGKDDIVIHGVGNLLTQIARCCKPVPGDDIVGFITVGSGVSIHKRDCSNMRALPEEKRNRLIEVEWGQGGDSVFQAGIEISARDRTGLLRDISSVLANERINLIDIQSHTDRKQQRVHSRLTVEVPGIETLVLVMDKLQQINDVESVKRTSL